MQQRQFTIPDPHAETRQQLAALGHGKIQVAVTELAQFPGHPQPVQPQRGVTAAGQHQLGRPYWPPIDKIRHVARDRGRRGVEVIHDQRRPRWQSRGIVGNRGDDIRRHGAVHRKQVSGIGTEPRRHCPGRLDESRPEPDRVGVGLVTGQPGRQARCPPRRPARKEHALACTRRPHHNGQPPPSSRSQPVMQRRPGDQRGGQRRGPELCPRKPPVSRRAVLSHRPLCHATPCLCRKSAATAPAVPCLTRPGTILRCQYRFRLCRRANAAGTLASR